MKRYFLTKHHRKQRCVVAISAGYLAISNFKFLELLFHTHIPSMIGKQYRPSNMCGSVANFTLMMHSVALKNEKFHIWMSVFSNSPHGTVVAPDIAAEKSWTRVHNYSQVQSASHAEDRCGLLMSSCSVVCGSVCLSKIMMSDVRLLYNLLAYLYKRGMSYNAIHPWTPMRHTDTRTPNRLLYLDHYNDR